VVLGIGLLALSIPMRFGDDQQGEEGIARVLGVVVDIVGLGLLALAAVTYPRSGRDPE
jgi:hypothetical protein